MPGIIINNPSESGAGKASEAIGEIAKDVKDQVAEAIEEGASQVFKNQTKVNPQQQQQKQQQDAQKRARVMQFISQFKQDEQLKNQWVMKKSQEKQKKEQEQQQQIQVKQFEVKKREQSMSTAVAQAKRGKEAKVKGGGA
jgi:hypothetical protein